MLVGLLAVVVAVAFFGKWEILAIYLLAILFVAAWRMRRRLLIEEITDNTSDGRLAKGAAALLAVELARIGDALANAHEGREIELAGENIKSLDVTTSVEDFAADLRSAVTAESKITVGPIGIPVGALLAVLGRFVQAPSLTASFHLTDGQVVLAARLAGVGQRGTWRIERPMESPPQGSAPGSLVIDLVSELACQIFTDLGLRGSTSWKATQHLVNALRCCRSSQGTRGINRMGLLTAERELLSAIDSDPHLFEAYYDLGVVYQEVDNIRPGYAASAFRKATDIDATRWEPWYALAHTAYREANANNKLDARAATEIIDHCKHVIDMEPGTPAMAKAFNLIGLVQRQRTDEPDLSGAARSREIASRLALKALVRAEFLGSRHDANPAFLRAQREQASQFLVRLARAYRYLWESEQGRQQPVGNWLRLSHIRHVFKLALQLNRTSVKLHLEYGKIALLLQKHGIAQRELNTASQISPRSPEIWVALAQASAEAAGYEESGERLRPAIAAAWHALELTDLLDPGLSSQDNIAVLKRILGGCKSEESRQLMRMLDFIDEVAEVAGHHERAIERLSELEYAGRHREAGFVCLLLGRESAVASNSEQGKADPGGTAESWYRKSLEHWEEGEWIEDIRRNGAHEELARALITEGRYKEAFDEIRRGLAMDAMSGWSHGVLGEVYYAMQDWQKAREAFNDALLLQPDCAEYHQSLGLCMWRIGSNLGDPDRRAAFTEAVRYFENYRALSESSALDYAQYWLGRIYTAADRPQEAIGHLLAVFSSDVMPLAKLWLGQAYRLADQLDAARQSLNEGLEAINESVESIGAEFEDKIARDWVAAGLHEQLAEVSIRRDGDQCEARPHIEEARRLAGNLADSDPDREQLLAACLDLDGKLLTRQGQFDQAIDTLHQALAYSADAEIYADLADACQVKALFAIGPERELVLRRAREACDQALATPGLDGRCRAAVEQTQQRLSRLAENPPLAASESDNGRARAQEEHVALT